VRVFTDTDTFWNEIETVAQLPEREVPRPSPGPEGEGKRTELGRILSAWLDAAGCEISPPIVIPHPSYGAISSDSNKCVLCAACANQCRVRSLRVSKEDYWLLYHTPIACLNCGACVALCPEEALSLEPGLRLDHSFLSRQEIGRSEALRCRECGRPFSTVKRSRRVSQKVEAARGDDPIRQELAALCPECRTKKAFTTHSDWATPR
jgi:ferredoxin